MFNLESNRKGETKTVSKRKEDNRNIQWISSMKKHDKKNTDNIESRN